MQCQAGPWPALQKRKGLVPLLCAQHCPVRLGGGGGEGGVSQLSLTVELLGNLKDPTPSPQPQGFPLTKLGGPLAPKVFSEFPDGSRVGQLGNASIRAFLERVCQSLSPDREREQGSQPPPPPENPDQAEPNKQRQLQAGSRLQGLGHLLQIREGSPTPQSARLRLLE